MGSALLLLATSSSLLVPTVDGIVVTALLFRLAQAQPVLPLGLLSLTALGAVAAVLLATGAAVPWVRAVRRPELLRAE